MNEKLSLALDEFLHVGVGLVIIIALVSVVTGLIRAFVPQEKLQKRLSKTGKFGGLMGALLGLPTPFCSASMVPVSMGMVEMGAPFAMVFSFLLSAPLANFVVVGFIFGVFGWKVALVYFLIVFIGSVLFGTLFGKTSIKNEVKRTNLDSKDTNVEDSSQQVVSCGTSSNNNSSQQVASCGTSSNSVCGESNPKLNEAFSFGWALFKRILPYVLIGAVISAALVAFVPDTWIQKYLGNDSPLAIPIAAGIGVPLYLRIEMAIPILKALIVKGMSMGAAIALIIGGTGASLPEIALISSMLKPKAIMAFILSVMTMAIVGGFIFYFFF
ncbi:permease [Sphingobacterium multivorum]|uniref:permease n=1 Tax=Sphingobacterium multivorum TaxID=28454 RepID=UPI0028A24AE1|nr:permease [Sphingobacterium multivorum]